MEHAASVRVRERANEIASNRDGARDRELTFLGEHAGERRAVEHLHRDVLPPCLAPVVEDAHAAGMIETCDGPRLTLEPDPKLLGQVRCEQLDRDVLAEPDVTSAVDLAHPAFADESEQLVARSEVSHDTRTAVAPRLFSAAR